MTISFLFALGGLAFLALLFLWVRRSASLSHEDKTFSGAHAPLAIGDRKEFSWLLADKIFSQEDLNFVSRQVSAVIRQEFVNGRRKIALLWLEQTRSGLDRLWSLYRKTARIHRTANLSVEFRIAATYLCFLLVCEIARILIWWSGPFAARNSVFRVMRTANRVADLSGRVLDGLDPLLLS